MNKHPPAPVTEGAQWRGLDTLPDQAVVLLAGLDIQGFPFERVEAVDNDHWNASHWRSRGFYAWHPLPAAPLAEDFT